MATILSPTGAATYRAADGSYGEQVRNHLIDLGLALAAAGLLGYSGLEGLRHPPLWPLAANRTQVAILRHNAGLT
ncbi:hypothetical protein ATK36_5255 [Amycolatopsis sulphurea]|uniref:Uncharacterized protein n=1 Tax=Amycolatopsis sulphurea TaxID=76022 RepID=A0A2A9FGK2_9PSEU|nr:hypothetical protein [Amycolatopsis sulphurea]PFG50053.1 hypothetical protein ATK36_5255 [Amycolatopsis sulphurea]